MQLVYLCFVPRTVGVFMFVVKNGVNLILRLWIVASPDISLAVRADFIEDIFEHVSLVNFHRIATGNRFCIFGDQCIAKAIGGGTERKKRDRRVCGEKPGRVDLPVN